MTDFIEETELPEDPVSRLALFLGAQNIAELLDDNQLGRIGQKVLDEYEIDETSREEWMKKTEKAMKLAKQVVEEKNYPWPKAANVKYPLIANAAIQFNARAYPAIVQGNDVVKCNVTGNDPDNAKASRGQRISEHMSYQLLHEQEEWEPDQDRQLLVLPIVGTDFKKSYFDPTLGRNVSVRVPAEKFVVNNNAKSLETVPRKTEVFELYPHEIIEKRNFGIYRDIDYPNPGSDDDYEPVEFLEQHRLLDLDEDDYPEPYIVTVHKDSGKVARIVPCFKPQGVELVDESKTQKFNMLDMMEAIAQGIEVPVARVGRITADQYYTKFGFIPDPDGGFYDIGLGVLLNPLNESINTTLNQLLDAGHLANTGGGFIGRGLRMKRGDVRFRPGEYKPIDATGDDLRKQVVPLQFPGPSPVLFQLLGLLIDAARDLSSINEVMAGDGQMAMAQPTTVMALIEQGQMVFSAIYKRVYRSLTQEFKKLFALNRVYLEEETYFRVLDDQKAIARQDYLSEDLDVQPVADPKLATDQQKLSRANFLSQFMADPFFDPIEIRRRILEAAKIEDIETLLKPPQQGPDIDSLVKLAKMENDRLKLDNETRKANAEIINRIADAALSLEKAEAENAGIQLEFYRTQLQSLIMSIRGTNGTRDNRGRVSGVEGPSGNEVRNGDAINGPTSVDGGMGGLRAIEGRGPSNMPDL